jgi:hypothetical protein
VAIEAARAALSPDELRREAAIGVAITFDDLLAAASAAEDEGVAGLARRVEELGTDAEAVPAARGQ